MLARINELTDLPQLQKRVFDDELIVEWKDRKILTESNATRAMADYCVAEVRVYAQISGPTGVIPAIDGRIIKSDSSVEACVNEELQHATNELRSPTNYRDTSTESGPLIDIIDPYLFSYAWDVTRTLRLGSIQLSNCITRCCEGTSVEATHATECDLTRFDEYRDEMAWSTRFQWLPFNVAFDKKKIPSDAIFHSVMRGNSHNLKLDLRIISYINNVHPIRNSRLYTTIERLIDILIPHFNIALIDINALGY